MTRALIQQMLEALKTFDVPDHMGKTLKVAQAQIAAESYLAAPEQSEPVGYVYSQDGRKEGCIQDSSVPNGTPLYTQPKAPEQSEPQPLEDLTGVKVCCGEYATCYRPCTPRGRWLAEREAPQTTELTDELASCVSTPETGLRLIGPHGGLKGDMPSPSAVEIASPLFNAIWDVCKTWDVNAPEYYVGYCGFNGLHAKLILDAVLAAQRSKT